jgi:MFS family permease
MHKTLQSRIVRHNLAVNLLDGSFFGLGMGFASYVTMIPLFVASLTDSTILIGLIATIHTLGWQVPQLFMAGRVSRVSQVRPLVLMMTLHERVPMFFLALTALLIPSISEGVALFAVYALLLWQSLGAGLTANGWQTMLGKVLPGSIRGTFYGVQSGAANLLSSGGALAGGWLLVALPYPYNFALCFAITGVAFMISWLFLAQTKEDPHDPGVLPAHPGWREQLRRWSALLRQDANFRWFIVARSLMQFAQMAMAFFTIYAVRAFNMDAATAGILTGVMLLAQMIASPLLGYLGDRFGHRSMLIVGCAAMALSALVAWLAPSLAWFYLVFILVGVVNSSQWTSILAMTSQFGDERTRPLYVGLSNTLIAPATLIAPLIGGVIADSFGFGATFFVSIIGGLVAATVLAFCVYSPVQRLRHAAAGSVAGD